MKAASPRSSSLTGRLVVLLTLSAATALLLAFAGFATITIVQVRGQTEQMLRSTTMALAVQSRVAVALRDKETAQELLRPLMVIPDIASAAVYDSDARELARYVSEQQEGGPDRAGAQLGTRWWLAVFGATRLEQRMPIVIGDNVVGSTLVEMDRTRRWSALWNQLGMLLGVVLVSLVVAWALGKRLMATIAEPISRLSEAAQTVTRDQNFAVRVERPGDNELGALVDCFNSMLDRIGVQRAELLAHRDRLEEDVTKRTQQLSAANATLSETVGELEEASQAALAASRSKSQFLAAMSHEIRTPMNGVLGMAELLLGTELDQRQRRFTQTLRQSGEALLAIINDILDFSKIEAGRLEVESIDFNLREVVEDLLDLLADGAHTKGLELIGTIDPKVPEVLRGDAMRIRQVLLNLVGNAIKFTERGEIQVRVQLDEDAGIDRNGACLLRFAIADTGVGIAPDKIDCLFRAFSQADGTTTRRYGGTGLGLAICKRLVELMEGSIGVDSEPGRGSTFWFSLRAAPGSPTIAVLPRRDLRNVRVLVVDDNATNRECLHHQLQLWGVLDAAAPGAREGLAMLSTAAARGQPFDLALIDMNMPDMDGLELVQAIRRVPELAGLRLVILASLAHGKELLEARNAGVSAFLNKPVRLAELNQCLTSALGRIVPEGASEGPVTGVAKARAFAGAILLVEDTPMNREVALAMLDDSGCDLDIAVNGLEAVAAVGQRHYDLVLMDCQMPELDGFEAARRIRALECEATAQGHGGAFAQRTPIVALTANALDGDRENCIAAGMDDYLSKPFTQAQLWAILERWLPPRQPAAARAALPGLALAPVAEGAAEVAAKVIAPQATPSVLDPAALEALRVLDGTPDESLVKRITAMYVADAQRLLHRMGSAASGMDSDELMRSAHALKSMCANVGAHAMATRCKLLEADARAARSATVAAQVRELEDDYEAVVAALHRSGYG